MKDVKKKRGRPARSGARRTRMMFRCNEDECRIIERAARISGLSLSEFIRTRIYNDSVEYIDRRNEELSNIYGSGEDNYEYDEYYEDELEDEEYI